MGLPVGRCLACSSGGAHVRQVAMLVGRRASSDARRAHGAIPRIFISACTWRRHALDARRFRVCPTLGFLAGVLSESATLDRLSNPRLKPARPQSVGRVAAARGLGAALI